MADISKPILLYELLWFWGRNVQGELVDIIALSQIHFMFAENNFTHRRPVFRASQSFWCYFPTHSFYSTWLYDIYVSCMIALSRYGDHSLCFIGNKSVIFCMRCHIIWTANVERDFHRSILSAACIGLLQSTNSITTYIHNLLMTSLIKVRWFRPADSWRPIFHMPWRSNENSIGYYPLACNIRYP